MMLHLIAAHDDHLVIGKDGKLPWRISQDLKHFKSVTMGKPILMGRGVFEEIGEKPLPGRRNIVLSKHSWDGIESYSSIDEALDTLLDEDVVFVIGGGQIYRQLIDLCNYMYITHVKGVHDGDVFFPEYRNKIGTEWVEISREIHEDFDFIEYSRKDKSYIIQ
jgi:dihydrofolate reductase